MDPDFQLPEKRAKKSRAMKQAFIEEYADQPTDDLNTTVDEGVNLIEKLANTANNLNGTTIKALYKLAAAKITAATTVMSERAQGTQNSGMLEEMRTEINVLGKELDGSPQEKPEGDQRREQEAEGSEDHRVPRPREKEARKTPRFRPRVGYGNGESRERSTGDGNGHGEGGGTSGPFE